MLALFVALWPTLAIDLPPASAVSSAPPPAALAKLPAAYVGRAADDGACTGPLVNDFAVLGRVADPEPALLARMTLDPAGRVGGCGAPVTAALRTLAPATLRPVGDARTDLALPADLAPLPDLVARRCVSRDTLRPYASLAFFGAPLEGVALELSPSRNVVHARLLDTRKTPTEVHLLGKVGLRTLEWCDRTDVAEGHCPNPTHGSILNVVLDGDTLVLTLALGFADVCGQDDLVVKSFPLPPAIRRALRDATKAP